MNRLRQLSSALMLVFLLAVCLDAKADVSSLNVGSFFSCELSGENHKKVKNTVGEVFKFKVEQILSERPLVASARFAQYSFWDVDKNGERCALLSTDPHLVLLTCSDHNSFVSQRLYDFKTKKLTITIFHAHGGGSSGVRFRYPSPNIPPVQVFDCH